MQLLKNSQKLVQFSPIKYFNVRIIQLHEQSLIDNNFFKTMKETLVDIINVIRPKKKRNANNRRRALQQQLQSSQTLEDQPQQQQAIRGNYYNNQEWSSDEQKAFEEIVKKYGSDFSLLLNNFPQRSRKQIMKKYSKMFEGQSKPRQKERTINNFFETDVLEIDRSSCCSKPEAIKPLQEI